MDIISKENLIQQIEEFMSNDYAYKPLILGQLTGANVLGHIIDTMTQFYEVKDVLFIQGIQDDMYSIGTLMKNNLFYGSLFERIPLDGMIPYNEFKPKFANEDIQYGEMIMMNIISSYKLIVINNAHLIPDKYLKYILTVLEVSSCKIIMIVDPFDIDGEQYSMYPVCVDAWDKLPINIAYARFLCGFESISINKKAKNAIKYNEKISKRSVGKMDLNQYITNDVNLCCEVHERQYASKFRKNQKVYVVDQGRCIYDNENHLHHSIRTGTLLRLGTVNETIDPIYKVARLHMSKVNLPIPMVYEKEPYMTPEHCILVVPANILHISFAALHRFRNAVMVTTSDRPALTIREQYAILRRCDNIMFANVKG